MISGTRTVLLSLLLVPVVGLRSSAQSQDPVHIEPPTLSERKNVPAHEDALPGSLKRVRVSTDLVLVPVTVVDGANHPVLDLEKKNFTLFEEGHEQPLQYFSIDDSPISVGILLDLSSSRADKIDTAREGLAKFFDECNPQDDYFVIGFADRPTLLSDSTQSTSTIAAKVSVAVPYGNTALLDAIYLGLSKLRNARYSRRALIIISDGGDNHSRYSAREIKALVQEADVQIYALGLFSSVFKTYEEWMGKRLLTEITEATGGRTITVKNPDELPDVTASLSRELRNQYVLGYRPVADRHFAQWRKIKVRVAPPQPGTVLHVYSKQGYSAAND